MEKGLVTVVIPNYNYAHYLREAIDSALAQTYDPVEVIVVDDGSSDGSREVIESYGTRIKSIFQQNQGVSAARNNGAAAGRGEFIAFLDADDVWLPEKLEKQAAAFAVDDEIGLVHVGVADIDENGNELRRQLDGLSGDVARELLLLERPVILGGGSGLAVRRTAFDEVGGFDTRMSTSADWDLCLGVSRRYRVAFIPEVLLRYRIHGSNMHSNVRAMEHDVLIGFEKAFSNGDRSLADIRSRCYANFYRTLAGSYFHAGQYVGFLQSGLQNLYYRAASLNDGGSN